MALMYSEINAGGVEVTSCPRQLMKIYIAFISAQALRPSTVILTFLPLLKKTKCSSRLDRLVFDQNRGLPPSLPSAMGTSTF